MEDITLIYTMLLGHGPMFAACVAGMVVALIWWPKAPLPAKLVLIACVLELLLIGVSTWMSGWYVPHMMRNGVPMAKLSITISAISIGTSVLGAVLFGLLIWAAFTGRRSAISTPR